MMTKDYDAVYEKAEQQQWAELPYAAYEAYCSTDPIVHLESGTVSSVKRGSKQQQVWLLTGE